MLTASTPDVYLASQSPRRRELLSQIGVRHAVVTVDVPEIRQPDELPGAYVQRLASAKASAGFAQVQSQGLPARPVMGADTIVVCDQLILEKPDDATEAAAMLRLLSGRSHEVITAVAICEGERLEHALSITEVRFRWLDDAEIAHYWHTGEPQDKAGGYGIQGFGAVFVDAINGSYSNVVGLPLEVSFQLLQKFNVPCWQSQG
jgi:septum formation protein